MGRAAFGARAPLVRCSRVTAGKPNRRAHPESQLCIEWSAARSRRSRSTSMVTSPVGKKGQIDERSLQQIRSEGLPEPIALLSSRLALAARRGRETNCQRLTRFRWSCPVARPRGLMLDEVIPEGDPGARKRGGVCAPGFLGQGIRHQAASSFFTQKPIPPNPARRKRGRKSIGHGPPDRRTLCRRRCGPAAEFLHADAKNRRGSFRDN